MLNKHDVTGSSPVWDANTQLKVEGSSRKEVRIVYPKGSTEEGSKVESLSESARNDLGKVTFFSFPSGTPKASCLGRPSFDSLDRAIMDMQKAMAEQLNRQLDFHAHLYAPLLKLKDAGGR